MLYTCFNEHLHDLYYDICYLNGSDSWYFHVDSTFVTHIVSHNVSDKNRWIPLMTAIETHIENMNKLIIFLEQFQFTFFLCEMPYQYAQSNNKYYY